MKYLTFLVLAFLLLGCSKEKSKKWLIADITVLDEHTGEPLECDVVLKWNTEALFGSSSHSADLGKTDSSGKLLIERKISRKDYNFKVEITANHTHYSFPGLWEPQKTIGLLPSSANLKIVRIPSKSYVVISILNNNCAGPTDTLLLGTLHPDYQNEPVYQEFSGCVDTVLNEQENYSGFIINPSLNLEYIVKRGTQIDTFNEIYPLTPKEFTYIDIVY
jgi:hypothetical protein